MNIYDMKVILKNKKVKHDYFIESSYEAGIVLFGSEVKSLKLGRGNLKNSYAKIINREVYLYDFHISIYPFAYYENHDPDRPKKLLLHKREIKKIYSKINEKGYTLVPFKVYFLKNKIKIGLFVAKGKRLYDKRETIRKKDMKKILVN